MDTKILPDGLLIVPETEFERSYIQSFGFGDLKCFVKHGFTATDVVGIKIGEDKEKEADRNLTITVTGDSSLSKRDLIGDLKNLVNKYGFGIVNTDVPLSASSFWDYFWDGMTSDEVVNIVFKESPGYIEYCERSPEQGRE